jgi:outer membrane protein assembly factor BamA
MKYPFRVLFLTVFLICIPLYEQWAVLASEQTAESISSKNRGKLFLFPILFYTPETTTGGGVVFNYSYWKGEDFSSGPPSNLNLVFVLTGNRQFNCEFKADNVWKKQTVFTSVDVRASKYPDRFYGIGNDTSESDEEKYTHSYVVVKPTLQRRVFPHFFVGIGYEFEYSINSDLKEGGILQSGEVLGRGGGVDSGIGFLLTYDTTNSRFFPTRGGRYLFTSWFYHHLIGSDYDFNRFTFDSRRYVSLFRDHVLAMQVQYTLMSGEVPFHMLSLLGGRNIMRGYYLGRYRDHDMLVFQAEYRLPLLWRIGAVGFAGVGDVAPDGKSFELNEFKYSAGVGLRIAMNTREKINLRIDYAFGKDSRGLYISLFEAF